MWTTKLNHIGKKVLYVKTGEKQGSTDVKEGFMMLSLNSDFFPMDVFPYELSKELYEHSRVYGYRPEYLGASVVGVTAALCGKGLCVRAQYTGISTVFIVLVGDSGTGKSPAMNTIIKPLTELQTRRLKEYRELYTGDDFNELKYAGQLYTINNCTIEGLTHYIQDTEHGTLIHADELLSWFRSIGQYKSGGNADMPQWLTMFNGDGINVIRAGKGLTHIPETRVSVLGGIQSSLVHELFKGDASKNGFIARLLFVDPDTPHVLELPEKRHELDCWHWIVERLDTLFNGSKYEATLTNEANKYYRLIDVSITNWMQKDITELGREYLAKQRIYLLRYVCILHALDCAVVGEFIPEIQETTVIRACKLADYFLTQFSRISHFEKEMVSLQENKVREMEAQFDALTGMTLDEMNKKYRGFLSTRTLRGIKQGYKKDPVKADELRREIAKVKALDSRLGIESMPPVVDTLEMLKKGNS